MATEQVSCHRCGEPSISQTILQKVIRIAKEKGRNNYRDYFALCQKCRA